MYGLIWRMLPGPWVSKFIMMMGLLVGAAALLWFFAFPAISPHMPFNDGAIDSGDVPGATPEGDPAGEPEVELEGGEAPAEGTEGGG